MDLRRVSMAASSVGGIRRVMWFWSMISLVAVMALMKG